MDRNRLKILLAAAALALPGCGGGSVGQGGGDRAAAASNVNRPGPTPAAGGAANAPTPNVSGGAATPSAAADAAREGASKAGGSRGQESPPPAAMPTPQIGSGGNDLSLFTQARAALNSDPELKAANLVLDVKEGVVTLSGTVANAGQKSKAEQLVRGAGPQTVRNQLRVSAGN